ncbi:MAG: hypothetical protein H0W72_08380 [Planctomycetes bacterium]|nr:hypothetical protein [Planctomycetota bacterium]
MNQAGPPLLYYVPEGILPPAHLRNGLAVSRPLSSATTPDGSAGLVFGAMYDPTTQAAWRRSDAGWWFLLARDAFTQAELDQCQRLRGDPYAVVENRGRRWRVPRLLQSDLTTQPGLVTEFGALDPISGAPRLCSVVRHEKLQDDLQRFFAGERFHPELGANNLAVLQLACRIVGLWYHLDWQELFALEIATWDWADAVTSAAADLVTPSARTDASA